MNCGALVVQDELATLMDRETASLKEIDRLQKEFLDHQKQYDVMNASSGTERSSDVSMSAGDSSSSSSSSITSRDRTLDAREKQVRHNVDCASCFACNLMLTIFARVFRRKWMSLLVSWHTVTTACMI
jgi:hypothetical protein